MFLVLKSNGPIARVPISPPRCARVSTVERLRTSNAVFTGRVLEIRESEGTQVVKFDVSKSWKYVHAKEVVVINNVHHEGPYFRESKSYLVFAYLNNGRLITGACSGTIDVELVSYEIDELNKWQRRSRSHRDSKR